MNLDLTDPVLHKELWDWVRSIAIFVYCGEHFIVVDYTENFSLDAEKNFRAYLEKGLFSEESIKETRQRFRNGISELSSDSFEQYLALPSTHTLSVDEMRQFFFDSSLGDFGVLQEQLERRLANGTEFDKNHLKMCRELSTRLPTFYINFDRKIYFHTNWERSYENSAYSDWRTKAQSFAHLVPVSERYWWHESADFWAVCL